MAAHRSGGLGRGLAVAAQQAQELVFVVGFAEIGVGTQRHRVRLVLLGKAGIISSSGLTAMRKYAIVAILILAAVATPPDVMSQVILFAAVYPLYEVSVILIRMIEKKREAQLRAEGLWEDEEEAE